MPVTERLQRARASFSLAVLAGLAGALLTSAPAAAQAPEERQEHVHNQLSETAHDLEDSSAAVQEAAAALRRVSVALPAAEQRLASARGALSAASAHREQMLAETRGAQSAAASAARAADDASADVAHRRAVIGRMARQAYMAGPGSSLSVLLDGESPGDLVDRVIFVKAAVRHQNNVLDSVSAARARLATRTADLRARERAVAERQQAAQTALERVRRLAGQAERARRDVTQQVNDRQAALALAERERAGDLRRHEQLVAESRQLAELIRQRTATARAARARAARAARAAAARAAAARAAAARAAAARSSRAAPPSPRADRSSDAATAVPPPTSRGSRLVWPAQGPVTSGFGWRIHPVYGYRKMHNGIDIGAAQGAPIVAGDSGVVIQAGPYGSAGNLTLVDHGDGLVTAYMHQSAIHVAVGQRVERGQRIGAIGSTGTSTGPHLHFETRVDGEPVDPMPYL